MMESVWRRRAPVWLRIVTGILLWPVIWFAFALAQWVPFDSMESPIPAQLFSIPAGLASWLIVRKASTPIVVALSALALLALSRILTAMVQVTRLLQDVP